MRQQRAELDFTEDKEVAVMGNELSGPHDEEDNQEPEGYGICEPVN